MTTPIAKQRTEPAAEGPSPQARHAATPADLARPVIFLGHLGLANNGFSAACQRMLERIRERGPVVVLDVARRGRGAMAGIGTLGNRLRQFARMFGTCVAARPHTLYLGFSGGFGQLMDVPFIALAQLFGMEIYFHHHSFAYINRPTWYTRLAIRCAPRGRHLVLCDMMRTELARIYDLPPERVQVLSNLGLIELAEPAPHGAGRQTEDDTIHVGFLSNITAAKGIFTFFEVVRLAQEMNIPVCARIAGPVEAAIRERFDAELARTPCVRYLGPAHGAQKQDFFRSIDVLLFPTTYHNEAEPLVVLEARSHGASVVAYARGCIGAMIDECSGLLVPADADFAEAAVPYLHRLMLERAGGARTDGNAERDAEDLRARRVAHFHADRIRAEATLSNAVAMISRRP